MRVGRAQNQRIQPAHLRMQKANGAAERFVGAK